VRFTTPLALLLLLTLPLFAALGWPSRGYGRKREAASLAIRLIIVLCLILALAGLELLRGADELAVVFLVDASDSMPAQAKAASFAYIEDALAEMGPDDQAAVILFGGDALVERPMSPSQELPPFTSIPNTTQTDLAEAIRLGLALYPPGAARRMVILSDGAATTGDAESAARLAANAGVEVIAVPFTYTPPAEVLLTEVDAPERLLQGENFDLKITLQATEPTPALIRVLAAGAVVYEGGVDLTRGLNTFSIPLTAGESGFTSFDIQVVPQQDTYYQNNELAAFTQIAGPPKILLVAPPAGEPLPFADQTRPDEFSNLLNALAAAGFNIDTVPPYGLPSELALLSEYAAVVLVDVPARQLNNRQMAALQSYVRDLGGGLLAVGGPTSYGVGGYFRTPLEETLPVDMEIKDQTRRPTLTIVFIIDRSGSMSEISGGFTKLELAKEAALRSVELLFPSDRVGVIAFDTAASWVVPIQEVGDGLAVRDALQRIGGGGGTDILAGLQAMAAELPNDPASVKHVILLTDGGANPTGIPELVEQLYLDYGITLTSVGVGSDAAPFLKDLARIGGGRYHFTDDPSTIPSIFTEETVLATRSYIIEETFFPQLASSSPILSGISEVPPLYGYVGTTAKSTAQTILVSPQGDPILAAWQYGLGKAVAWTSDASPRWARDWVPWEGFPAFWAQAVRFVLNENVESALLVRVEQNGETATLIVDAQTEDGLYLNNYTLQANVIAPDGEVIAVDLTQVAPGRYEAAFTPDQQGAYLIRVDGTSPQGDQSLAQIAGWVLSYSPEYRTLQSDPDALYRLIALIDGRITTGDPAEAFARTLTAPPDTRPIWPELLLLAALLLPVDIAVRRLALDRRDVQRAWARLTSRLRLAPASAAPAPPPPRSQRIASLMQAKERAREEREEGVQVGRETGRQVGRETGKQVYRETGIQVGKLVVERGKSKEEGEKGEARVLQPLPKEEPVPPPVKPARETPPEEKKPASTTSHLLARKRQRKQRKQ